MYVFEVYSENSDHILASFEHVLKETYGIDLHDEPYFIVADKAGENSKAFGKRYIICFAHALDLAFKYAKKRFDAKHRNTALDRSLRAMHDLTSYCKYIKM